MGAHALGLLRAQGGGPRHGPAEQTPNGDLVESGGGDYSLAQALRSRSFWLIFFTWLAYSFCLHLVMARLVPRAKGVGIAPVQAATIRRWLEELGGVTVGSPAVTAFSCFPAVWSPAHH